MIPHRVRLALALAAPLALGAPALAWMADEYVSPGQARLKADVTYLADDAREGRGPGTKGLDAAADYIATAFKEVGLKPAPGADGYFQHFELPGRRELVDGSRLAAKKGDGPSIDAVLKTEFSPLSLGGPVELNDVPLVFAGYGITAEDESLKLKYDDYEGIDAKDKAVLIIRREPQQGKEDSPFGGKETTTFASFNHKVANAAKHGAKLVLMVNDGFTVKDGKDEILGFRDAGGAGTADFGFFMISRDYANKLLKEANQPSLADLEAKIDEELKPQSKALEGVTVNALAKVDSKGTKVKNVIGVLEGEGPLADETIVVGAHYDHLGMGGAGSMAFGTHAIHNGADDNASGTATVLEMARRLARRTDPLPRRVVFMAFSAEELGLIGSAYYVNHPLFPLDKTVAMVNFDMVGRLNKENRLTVFGTGTSPKFEELVTVLASDQGITAKNIVGTQGEFFQSDHASFYRKDIPVIFFFTGTHPEYHRPADDTPLINFDGMAKIANVGELLLLDLVKRPVRPEFIKLGRNGPANRAAASAPVPAVTPSSRAMGSAYFGSRPAYGESPEGGGVKLDGVSEGGPAEKAGLKAGDVIVKFGGKEVKDIDSYMTAMGQHKAGDTVEVVVMRDGKEVKLEAKLTPRPGASPKN